MPTKSNKTRVTYGDQQLPTRGVICNRDLNFVNARINQQAKPIISVKNLINPRISCKNGFGKSKNNNNGYIWYPQMNTDLKYNPNLGGYVNSNGPNGPYFALGIGNYPRNMYNKVFFGTAPMTPEKNLPEYHAVYPGDEDTIPHILYGPDTKIGDYIAYFSLYDGEQLSRILKGPGGNKILGPWRKSSQNDLQFGTDKRSRSPEKNEPQYHFIFEDVNTDEDQEVEDILNDPDTKTGDIIRYSGNNQEAEKIARISRDKNGNKRLGPWRYTHDYLNFGETKTYKKTKNPANTKKTKNPANTKKK